MFAGLLCPTLAERHRSTKNQTKNSSLGRSGYPEEMEAKRSEFSGSCLPSRQGI